MNKRIKNKWVKALRSGKYKKTTGTLRQTNENESTDAKEFAYCCLGVLCDLYAKETKLGEWDTDDTFLVKAKDYDDADATLPETVMKWAGLASCDGDFGAEKVTYKGKFDSLAGLNDSAKKKGFNYIADFIESKF